MKKKIFSVVLMCSMAIAGNAQIYGYDSWTQLPTRNIYDEGLMNMHLRVMSETAARRQKLYNDYGMLTVNAYKEERWYDVILYATKTLEIDPESDFLYYVRGYAYEQIGNEKEAMRDYKTGKKYGNKDAADALERLRMKERQGQDNKYSSK